VFNRHGKTRWVVVAGGLVTTTILILFIWGLVPKTSEETRTYALAALATACLALLVFVARRLFWRDRQRALAAFARRRGFHLDPERRSWQEPWHSDFELFGGQGALERWNVLTGMWRHVPVEVFDCERNPDAEPESERRTVAVVGLELDVPGIIIEPNRTNLPRQEGSFITWYGAVDGEAEMSDFQRRYVVMAEDHVAAGQLLHPEMETFLLKNWNIGIQIVGRRAVFYGERLLQPAEIRQLLDFAAGFCGLIPSHVNRDGEATFEQRG